MAEAIFAKYGGSTLDPTKLVSNDVKVSLGLNNNATLDDILNRIATGAGIDLIDPHNVPFTASLLWYNAQPIVASNIKVTFPDNTTRNYMTDRNGNIQFTSPPGTVILNDLSCGYFDLTPGNQSIECKIGQNWNNVIMMRNQRFSNGATHTFTSNQTITLSPCINSYDVECRGCDGKPTTGTIKIEAFLGYHYENMYGPQNTMNITVLRHGVIHNSSLFGSVSYSGYFYSNKNTQQTSPICGTNGEYGEIKKINNLRSTGTISVVVGKNLNRNMWINEYNKGHGVQSPTSHWHHIPGYNIFANHDHFLNGDTGPTSSFGSLVIANGGRGGKQTGTFNTTYDYFTLTNLTNYIGPESNNNIYVSMRVRGDHNNDTSSYSYASYNILFDQPVNNGYVKMMNIQYK